MEYGPLAGCAIHLNPAVHVLYDLVADVEAEARSHTRFFGGEERFENAVQVLLGDARPLI